MPGGDTKNSGGIADVIDGSRRTSCCTGVRGHGHYKGFCFNTLDKKPELVRKTSGILCAGLAIYDAWLFLKKGKWLRKFGMVFLTAGAISNTYDRLIRGKVIDYSGIQWKNSRFRRLTANLADVYVVIGAAVTGVAKIFRR